MYEFFEIAYGLAGNSLCLFLGTGFSKALTDGKAPTWIELLKKCCDHLKEPDKLKDELFEEDTSVLPLEECAQIIEIELKKEHKDIYKIIAEIIDELEVDEDACNEIKKFLEKFDGLKIITTNYDTLIEDHLLSGRCNSFCPGRPIPKRKSGIDIYHIHGSTKSPQDMVVTATDYYDFINTSGYFHNKIHSLIQEYTTVIIGYSLGDPNLKPIFNNYSKTNLSSLNRGSLFYFSRKDIPLHIKDYYEKCYSIRAIKARSINFLFKRIESRYDDANENFEKRQKILSNMLTDKKKRYRDSFLKLRHSFFHIISAAASIGEPITSEGMTRLFNQVIKHKIEYTRESQAWEQYDHLSEWLVFLGSNMNIRGTKLESTYLDAVKHSMRTMSRDRYIGYCWEAYQTWLYHWESLTMDNREMIKDFVESERLGPDARSIVS